MQEVLLFREHMPQAAVAEEPTPAQVVLKQKKKLLEVAEVVQLMAPVALTKKMRLS